MPRLPKLLISDEALAIIEEESRYISAETGGSLFGVSGEEGTIIITHATKPGPNAYHSSSAFEKDLHYQQNLLNEMNKQFNVDYVGEWHKHPSIINHPSAGDLHTAKSILNDPEWDKEELVVIIVNINYEKVIISPYYISKNTPNFIPIESETISLRGIHPKKMFEHPKQTNFIERKEIKIQAEKLKNNDTKKWYETKEGKKRLKIEKESLEKIGLDYKTILRDEKKICFIFEVKNTIHFDKIIITLPHYYPTSPPELNVQREEEFITFMPAKINAWNSKFRISDIVFDLVDFNSPDYQQLVKILTKMEKKSRRILRDKIDKTHTWFMSSDGKKRMKQEIKLLKKNNLKKVSMNPIKEGVALIISNIVKNDEKINLIFECFQNQFPYKIPRIIIEHKKGRIAVCLPPDFMWDKSKHLNEIAELILSDLSYFI